MILSLEVTSPSMTGASRHTFREEGGSIGRESDNAWVLPHSKVSALHAVISHRSGVYYIEDRSRNGVYLNSSKNRLERGRPHGLKSGDRILIEPYEIRVSVSREQGDRSDQGIGSVSAGQLPPAGFNAADPFDADDPFAPGPVAAPLLPSNEADADHRELDPLELLNLGAKRAPQKKKVPTARDLDSASLLEGHYKPPAVVPVPSFASPASVNSIPEDYDPLAPDDGMPISASPPPVDLRGAYRAREERRDPRPLEPVDEPQPVQVAPPFKESRPPAREPLPLSREALPRSPEPAREPLLPVQEAVPPVHEPLHPMRDRAAEPPANRAADSIDFGAVLAGAGLDPASITPEVAHEFGRILRVVVSGVMDVMRSRQQIKDEFRMQGTRVRKIDNNPLKFSANVDDALHNLLMKRNRAYMSPVEAFEDAFADLRNHQIAMLAGMRTAFESMLAEFDPDRLQQEFDRQLAKGLVPAKLRYWDSYRERQQQAIKDPEATFRHLFGDEFARAYEDQLRALKAGARPAGGGDSTTPKQSDS
ncbi:MAG: type VI secretion system-associated FHA domain protein TagH [Vicinamibacterales bacterium]